MMRKLACVAIVGVALSLTSAACHADQAAAQPLAINVGQPFTLAGGQEATVNGENMRIRFDQVLEDSRCPKQVECFWTGQARVSLLVEPNGRGESTLEFNTNPAPDQNDQMARLDEYTFTMDSLEPYPQTPEQSIPLADYRLRLTVGKD
jgi:hypothetical protein